MQNIVDEASEVAERTCQSCGEPGARSQCPCKASFYCDEECQRASWRRHKGECTKSMRKKIDDKQQELGKDSQQLTARWTALGEVYLRQRRYAEAQECLEEVSRLLLLHNQTKTPEGAALCESLSKVYQRMDRKCDAVTWNNTALEIYGILADGSDTLDVARVLARRARLLWTWHRNQPEELQQTLSHAIALFQRLCRSSEARPIPNLPYENARFYTLMARLMWCGNSTHSDTNAEDAATCLATVVEHETRVSMSPEDPNTVKVMLKAGELYADMEMWDRARALLEEGANLLQTHHLGDDNTRRKLLHALSRCLCAKGKLQLALGMRQQALRLVKKIGCNAKWRAEAERHLAQILRRIDEKEKGEKRMLKAVSFAEGMDQESPTVKVLLGRILFDLALLRIDRGNLPGAKEALQSSVALYDAVGIRCGKAKCGRGLLKKLEEGAEVDGEERCPCCGGVEGNWWD